MFSYLSYNLSQNHLNRQISCFLKSLEEEFPTWGNDGICHGYAFMFWRASIINERKIYIKRLINLSRMSTLEIKKMGRSLSYYRSHFKTNEPQLKNKLIECKHIEEKKAARDFHHKTLQYEWIQKTTPEYRETVAIAEDLYIFINSLLFSFWPHNLSTTRLKIKQNDFINILMIIPPDKFICNGEKEYKDSEGPLNFPIKNVLQFDFLFTKSELARTLEQVVRPDDQVIVYSSKHIVNLTQCILYDSNAWFGLGDYISFRRVETALFKQLFLSRQWPEKKWWKKCKYFPIGFIVFSNVDAKNETRPTVENLLENILRNRPASINLKGWRNLTALYYASVNNNASVVSELLNKKADIHSAEKEHIIYAATAQGAEDVLKVFHEFKTDLTVEYKPGGTPLHVACVCGHLNLAQYLIDQNADINMSVKDGTPLTAAISGGWADVVELLISRKANLEQANQSQAGVDAVLVATQHNRFDVLINLAKHNFNLNRPSNTGETPLMVAAQQGHFSMFSWLAQQPHANINSRTNKFQNSPIHFAARDGHLDIVKKLVDLKADLNATNVEGNTPLHLSALRDNFPVIKFLINQATIDTQLKNIDSLTFFTCAVLHCSEITIRYLMHHRIYDLMCLLLEVKNLKHMHSWFLTELIDMRPILTDEFIKMVNTMQNPEECHQKIHSVRCQENALGILFNRKFSSSMLGFGRFFRSHPLPEYMLKIKQQCQLVPSKEESKASDYFLV